jgi:hypothetical protein
MHVEILYVFSYKVLNKFTVLHSSYIERPARFDLHVILNSLFSQYHQLSRLFQLTTGMKT